MKKRSKASRAKAGRTKTPPVSVPSQTSGWGPAESSPQPARLVADLPPGTLRQDDPDGQLYEAICQRAWPAFIEWALGNVEVCNQFTVATGLVVARKQSAIEAEIDKVTGSGASVADRFVEWVTVELYGIDGAPAAYRAELARRRQGEAT
jgi:hypothetical protein